MGGTNDSDNLVDLTPEEHYVAHQLLAKMYPNQTKLSYAAACMGSIRANNKLYGWLRIRISDNMKQNNPNAGGEARRRYSSKYGAPNKGYVHTAATKKLLSEQRMGSKNPNVSGQARKTTTYLVSVATGDVMVYDSLKEAERVVGANHASVWNNRKMGKPYKGYYWYVGSEYNPDGEL